MSKILRLDCSGDCFVAVAPRNDSGLIVIQRIHSRAKKRGRPACPDCRQAGGRQVAKCPCDKKTKDCHADSILLRKIRGWDCFGCARDGSSISIVSFDHFTKMRLCGMMAMGGKL